MTQRNVPINKGNYSMDTPEREAQFHEKLGSAWPAGYEAYRRDWVDNARNQIVPDYPLLIDLELSSVCNLRCPMCYTISPQFRKHVNAKVMDLAMFKRIVDEIGGKVPALRLSLRGESTVHPDFVEAIEYAKAGGIKEVSTLTHGGRLTLEYFKAIQAAGIDWITISIDGLKETYERIRKPLKFDDLIEKLRCIKQYKSDNGLERPVIKVQGIWPAIKDDVQEYYDTFQPITDLVAFNPLIDYLSNDTDIEYLSEFTCPQQYQRLVIGADGLAMKCSNDEENREVIGDAKMQTIHEIWHGEKMQRVRELHLRPCGFLESAVCRKCYLPRKTVGEVANVDNRSFVVHNYTHRTQLIGK